MVRNIAASSGEPIGLRDRYISVSVGPGATAFTVMFDCANSPAQVRVAASNAALAAAYGVRRAVPSVTMLVTLTIRPQLPASIPGNTAWVTCTATRTFK